MRASYPKNTYSTWLPSFYRSYFSSASYELPQQSRRTIMCTSIVKMLHNLGFRQKTNWIYYVDWFLLLYMYRAQLHNRPICEVYLDAEHIWGYFTLGLILTID